MAAHTRELDRDILLARAKGDMILAWALRLDLRQAQAACSHVPNPERPERCYKCGLSPLAASKPGLVKSRKRPLELGKRTA